MLISLTTESILLEGHIDIVDIDVLYPMLREHRDIPVDITSCKSAHTAVVQVLLACGSTVIGADAVNDWRQFLRPNHQFMIKKKD